MKTMRGGRGLGDTIYLQAIASHLTADGTQMRVASDFPDVFLSLGSRVKVIPFTRTGIDVLAHYVGRKGIAGTSQFTDMCLQAGIRREIDLRLDWQTTDSTLVHHITELASGRPIVCLQLARAPMGRSDGFGAELLPDCLSMQKAVNAVAGRALVVQIGAGRALHEFSGVELDMAGRTTPAQLIDIAAMASAFIGYPSFVVPLAESLDKPALIFWSKRGLRSQTPFIAQITPEKILHKVSCRAIMDNASDEEIYASTNSLF